MQYNMALHTSKSNHICMR